MGLRCTTPFFVSHLCFCAKLLSVSLIVHGLQPCLLQRGKKKGLTLSNCLPRCLCSSGSGTDNYVHRYLCTGLPWEPSLWYRSSRHLKDIGSTELRVSLCSVQGYLVWSLLLCCPGDAKTSPFAKDFWAQTTEVIRFCPARWIVLIIFVLSPDQKKLKRY